MVINHFWIELAFLVLVALSSLIQAVTILRRWHRPHETVSLNTLRLALLMRLLGFFAAVAALTCSYYVDQLDAYEHARKVSILTEVIGVLTPLGAFLAFAPIRYYGVARAGASNWLRRAADYRLILLCAATALIIIVDRLLLPTSVLIACENIRMATQTPARLDAKASPSFRCSRGD